jgi:hypothetical protein
VNDFGLEHRADFAPTSLATQLFTTIKDIVDELDGHAASQTASSGASRQGTATREQARLAVREDLKAISGTAAVMSDKFPGLDEKFRLPREDNDQDLMSAGNAFIAEATPIAADFIAHEMAADFLDDLRADLQALEDSMSAQSAGKGHRIAAGAAIDQLIDNGVAAVRKLNAIMKNKYANNPAVLAQWVSASHTERDPRHKGAPSSTPTSGGSGSSSGGGASSGTGGSSSGGGGSTPGGSTTGGSTPGSGSGG